MEPFTPSPLFVPALAVATMVSVIATAFLIARAMGRNERREARNDVESLIERFEGFLEGRSSESALRRGVQVAPRRAFWSALETASLEWTRAERRKVSRALERNRHAVRERRALRDEPDPRRELAAHRLGLLMSPRSRRALRRALVVGPEWVAFAAAKSLARDRDARALRWLLAHPHAFLRRNPAAKTALLRLFGRGALPMLAATLNAGVNDPTMERAIIETLGLGRHGLAAGAIAKRLDSPNLEIRIAAARALGRLQAAERADELLQALADDGWQVRAQAAWALGRSGVARAVTALAARLEDKSWWVRRHAAYALREIAPEGQVALRHAIESSGDPYARDMAREALEVGSLAPNNATNASTAALADARP